MPRRGRYTKHELLPDSRYSSLVVARFINKLMMRGKKSTAERIMYDAMSLIERRKSAVGAQVKRILRGKIRVEIRHFVNRFRQSVIGVDAVVTRKALDDLQRSGVIKTVRHRLIFSVERKARQETRLEDHANRLSRSLLGRQVRVATEQTVILAGRVRRRALTNL